MKRTLRLVRAVESQEHPVDALHEAYVLGFRDGDLGGVGQFVLPEQLPILGGDLLERRALVDLASFNF